MPKTNSIIPHTVRKLYVEDFIPDDTQSFLIKHTNLYKYKRESTSPLILHFQTPTPFTKMIKEEA